MSRADIGEELVEVRTATLPDPFLVRAITEGGQGPSARTVRR